MIRMNKNENRQLRIKIGSSDGSVFKIQSARYQSCFCWHGKHIVEQEDTCDITGRTVSAMINPQNKGLYIVKFFLRISGESVIRTVRIQVNEM